MATRQRSLASLSRRQFGLVTGPSSAVVSHITSAFVQDLLPRASAGIEVTTDRSPGERRGIVVHRNSLNLNDIVNVRGIPSTSVYRTLIDLCASQPEPTCEKPWMLL